MSLPEKRSLISEAGPLSIRQQCELLGVSRSGYYYEPVGESALNLELMRHIDQEYLKHPFYGYRKMRMHLCELGYPVSNNRTQRLMQKMGISAVYPRPKLSRPGKGHKIYPYLLKGLRIDRPNQVWGVDITFIPLIKGFFYLVAIMDWYSRYVLSWRLSNSMENSFCLDALADALSWCRPEIFNSDQGAQFTAANFTAMLNESNVRISMDGKGRFLDNIFIERIWRSLKYEEVYLKQYKDGRQAHEGIRKYFEFYNYQRFHQHLDYKTPWAIFTGEEKLTNFPGAEC